MNLTKFFQKWMRPKEKKYFETTFDQNLSTYFVARKNPEKINTFEFGLSDALSRLWAEQNTPELKPLAKPMEKLAQNLYSVDEQNEEVSPFIYVMY